MLPSLLHANTQKKSWGLKLRNHSRFVNDRLMSNEIGYPWIFCNFRLLMIISPSFQHLSKQYWLSGMITCSEWQSFVSSDLVASISCFNTHLFMVGGIKTGTYSGKLAWQTWGQWTAWSKTQGVAANILLELKLQYIPTAGLNAQFWVIA